MAVDIMRALLYEAFPGAEVEIVDRTGGGDHFQVNVTASAFDGLSLVDQHRLVNRALAAPLADGTIHELRITTKGTR
jgi:stress-induced morphogen